MASLTDAYGPEEGEKAWDAISSTLGTEFRGEILMSLLLGRRSHVIRIHGFRDYRNTHNKYVEFIKTIRTYGGLGLKEAKDLADSINEGNSEMLELVSNVRRHDCVAAFRALNITST